MTEPQRTEPPMSAEAFMDWYDQQPDGERYELLNGRIYKMQSERATHARAKGALYIALVNAIRARKLPCEAFVDGMAVRVDDQTVFEPDVLVQCGSPVAGQTIVMRDPAIVVEVLSPASQHVDFYRKFNGYFRNRAVMHYLIVNSVDGNLVHHSRMPDGRIESAHRDGGKLALHPPGLELDLDALFKGGFGG